MAKTQGKQIRPLGRGNDDFGPGKANDVVYAGCTVMLDASGRAINGAAATGCIGVGVARTNRGLDRFDSTGKSDGDVKVLWDEGIWPMVNSAIAPFLSSDQPGLLVYIEDNETASKTNQSSTLSVMGLFHHLDADGVWVDMGKRVGAFALDMTTVTDASAAHLAGSETFTGVKTFASSADPVFAKEADHTTNVVATTTAATVGGALTVAAGAGNTSGAGGGLAAKGGAGGSSGTGGAASLVGGAGGSSSGTGGAAKTIGGAGTAGNATGGAAGTVGGAGQGSAAGGEADLTGGIGGTTGAGGAAKVAGGAGGATSGTGGAASLTGGAGTNGNANGGAVTIDGGAKNGAGADGAINIGTNQGAITIGKSGVLMTRNAPTAAGASTDAIADPGTGAAIPVTQNGYVPIVTAGAETNTLAIPTFRGQRITLTCDTHVSGDRVVTSAQRINQAGNTIMTFNTAADTIELVAITVAGALRWQVAFNEGVTLS